MRADDRGEAAATGRRPIVVVELAESFLLAQPVELGGDDRSGALVGGPSELGVELQGCRPDQAFPVHNPVRAFEHYRSNCHF